MRADLNLTAHGDAPFLLGASAFSFRDLARAIKREGACLAGVKAVLLEGDHSLKAYARLLACFEQGVAVLACGSARFALPGYREQVSEEAGTDFAPWALPEDHPSALHGGRLNELLRSGLDAGRSLFVVRTSGSSRAASKFVVHGFEKFLEKHRCYPRHFERTAAFSPFDSIASFETLSETLAHGTSIAHLASLQPAVVASALRHHAVDYFQTTPTFLSLLLLTNGAANLPSLKKIAYGSEPAEPKSLMEIRRRLPGVRLWQTYGMTEIGILRTLCPEDDPAVFRPDEIYNPYRVREGILEVRSPTQLLGYLNHPAADLLEDGWFRTGDVAEEVGSWLRVRGRKSDLLNVAGHKFLPSELEELASLCPNVASASVLGEKNFLVGTAVLMTVYLREPEEEVAFRGRWRLYAEKLLPAYMHPHRIDVKIGNPPATDRFKKER